MDNKNSKTIDENNFDPLNSMHQIHFSEDFYTSILEGRKTQTARINEPVPQLGKAKAIFSDERSIPIIITKVSYKRFENLTIEDVQKDGFDAKQKLWQILVGFYPDLKETDLLMLIEFRCLR